jgi:hypothetical protein
LTNEARECLAGAPSLPDGSAIEQEISGDFDGDGRDDRVQFVRLSYDPAEKPPRRRTAVRIVFGRGVSTSLQRLYEAQSIIGVADLDGDKRDEVLLQMDGNDAGVGAILVVRTCRFEAVFEADHQPYGFWYDSHSNGDPGGGWGFVCPSRGDEGRDIVEVRYEPEIDDLDRNDGEAVVKALQRPDLTYRWRRRTLRLTGTRVDVVARDSGRSVGIDKEVPMINRFACGRVDPP